MNLLKNPIMGYSFNDPELMRKALTHPSFVNESKDTSLSDYQRLEFLGDAVLGLCLAEILFLRYPEMSEGELSRLRASLVDQPRLAWLAVQNGIATHIALGRGEDLAGGREKPSILSDVFEALLGGIYLDAGFDTVKQIIGRLYASLLEQQFTAATCIDPKSELQEWLAASQKPSPSYSLVSENGPPHERIFKISVSVGNDFIAEGEGRSKKAAQQEAARSALEKMKALN